MTLPTIAVLSASLAVASGYLAPPFSTTFITQDVGPTGEVLAEPIHTPSVVLRPENSVARQIKTGEALRCNVELDVKEGTVQGIPADIRRIMLDCHGARFVVVGIQFQETR